MSSGQKACWDDEDDWHSFKCGAANIAHAGWEVYSPQAHHAKIGFKEHKLTGNLLIEYVLAQMQVSEILAKGREIEALKKKLAELEGK